MAYACDFSPMGYQNGCSDNNGDRATLAIAGSTPDNKGGGILFWAYSIAEANQAFDAYRAAGSIGSPSSPQTTLTQLGSFVGTFGSMESSVEIGASTDREISSTDFLSCTPRRFC